MLTASNVLAGMLLIGEYLPGGPNLDTRVSEPGVHTVVFLGLAALGMATLWMAVAADMGASLPVIANGLRLLRFD